LQELRTAQTLTICHPERCTSPGLPGWERVEGSRECFSCRNRFREFSGECLDAAWADEAASGSLDSAPFASPMDAILWRSARDDRD